jgi:hypothetical protein
MSGTLHLGDKVNNKPLGGKAYGSTAHLSNSRLGPSDHHCHEGQERIATVKARDKYDCIIVQEKLDGSNVCVARVDGKLIALTRSGYLASTSPYEQHHIFQNWVERNEGMFSFLRDGERVSGESLIQAHGTIYESVLSPLYVFDLFRDNKRVCLDEYKNRLSSCGLWFAPIIHEDGPISVLDALALVGERGCANSVGLPEGVVYRVYRNGIFDFMCKYVRPEKQDGIYLPEVSGKEAKWNYLLEVNR